MKKPKTIKAIRKIFNDWMDKLEVEKDKEEDTAIVSSFNQWLDDLVFNDFFGTEGQNDPRGDHRD